jgi:hypothetical protein
MKRILLVILAAVVLPGCDSCPYSVDSIEADARSSAYFGVANATLAEQVWTDLGFQATRDGLSVHAEKDGLEVFMGMDGNGTSMWLRDRLGNADFQSYEAARTYVDAHMVAASQRINATRQSFEAQVDWPPFEVVTPAQGSISVC